MVLRSLIFLSLNCMATAVEEPPLQEAASYISRECTAAQLLQTDTPNDDHGQGVYFERAKALLCMLEPVSELILRIDRPVCKALQGVYCEMQRLNHLSSEQPLPWSPAHKIKNLEELMASLVQLVNSVDSLNVKMFLMGLGEDAKSLVAEIVTAPEVRTLKADMADLSFLVCLMEDVQVSVHDVTVVLLGYAEKIHLQNNRNFFLHWGFIPYSFPDNIAYKFFYGEKIDFFICQLMDGCKSLQGVYGRQVQTYRAYLNWRNQANWWDFKIGLLRSGVKDSGAVREEFSWIKETLLREGGNLENALQYLCKLESLVLEPQVRKDAIQELVEWLHVGREGASAIWGGGRVRKVTKHQLNEVICKLEKLQENKTEGFYNFIVQSLPKQRAWRLRGVTHDLPAGLYKDVIEGHNALQFIADMLEAGQSSANPDRNREERARSQRNANSYLEYLCTHLSVSALFELLKQIAQLESMFFLSGVIWKAIENRGWCSVNSIFSYLEFVQSLEGSDSDYVDKEVQKAGDFLCTMGYERSGRVRVRSNRVCPGGVAMQRLSDAQKLAQTLSENEDTEGCVS